MSKSNSFNEKLRSSVPEIDNFKSEDLTILNKISDSMDALRLNIDNQELLIYTNLSSIVYLMQINILMIKNHGKKSDIKRLNTIVYVSLEIIRKFLFY